MKLNYRILLSVCLLAAACLVAGCETTDGKKSHHEGKRMLELEEH